LKEEIPDVVGPTEGCPSFQSQYTCASQNGFMLQSQMVGASSAQEQHKIFSVNKIIN
jgi:hypothetical protein